MPGKRITDHQVTKYKTLRVNYSQEAAAAKTGISVASARRIETRQSLPSQRPPRNWRTRQDPLADVWSSEVIPLLEAKPGLMAVTVLEELQRRHPEQFDESVLRTLQRRIRQWRAEHGEERELFFAQEHPPGRLGLSDFTVADELGVVVAGAAFAHRLYQFAFAHSGWRHVSVVIGGESFQALSSGLQAALWMAGGVPEEHRTDSLSAAFNNLAEQEELTRNYDGLCAHYGMRASRNNPGESHENGSIEARQGSLKLALDQALLLRGSRAFDALHGYEQFVAEVVRRLNARCARGWEAERACLKPLPARRTGGLRGDRRQGQQVRRVHRQELDVQRAVALGRAPAEGEVVQRPPRSLARRGEGVRVREAVQQLEREVSAPNRLAAHAAGAQAQAWRVRPLGAARRHVPAQRIRPDLGPHQRAAAGAAGVPVDGRSARPG